MIRRAFAAFALTLAVPVGVQAGEDATRTGAELYAVHCSSCHGANLRGTTNGPSLQGVGVAAVDFSLTTGRMPLAAPGVEPVHQQPQFAPSEVDALEAYVAARAPGGPAIPRVALNADLAHGRKVYEENCQACHGPTAKGAIVGSGWVAPSLDRASVVQIAEAVRIGPGLMPRFDVRTIGDRDLDALVRYVNVLQTAPDDRGGYDLGGGGPVAEGLAAWVFGLGALALVIRSIGTKAGE